MPANDRQKREGSGFTQLLAAMAVLISLGALGGVVFKLNDQNAGSPSASAATPIAATSPVEHVKLVVKSDEEEGKLGPDGNWHDAFLPADFSVKAGATVKVTVYNYDDMPHSFTASELGLNVTIPAGSGTEENPGKVTFTFKAPQKAGTYDWFCAIPCDPWAMAHYGYMKGRVTVT